MYCRRASYNMIRSWIANSRSKKVIYKKDTCDVILLINMIITYKDFTYLHFVNHKDFYIDIIMLDVFCKFYHQITKSSFVIKIDFFRNETFE